MGRLACLASLPVGSVSAFGWSLFSSSQPDIEHGQDCKYLYVLCSRKKRLECIIHNIWTDYLDQEDPIERFEDLCNEKNTKHF